ncbi:hypothetical protein ACFWIR_38705, partial [Streptomyces olivaceus]
AMNYVPNKKSLAGAVSGDEGSAAMAAGAAQGRATPGTPRWGAVEADNPIKEYMTKVLNGADAKWGGRPGPPPPAPNPPPQTTPKHPGGKPPPTHTPNT